MKSNTNNQNGNGEQQVIAIEKKNTNILAVLGLIFAFFIPLVGLILSIIGLVQSKKMDDGKGLAIGGIVTSAVLLVFHIIIFVVVVFFLIFTDSYDYNNYDYNDYYYYNDIFDY